MSEYHVLQFDGTTCGTRNCAAASGAMAIAFAGGPELTARQFRNLSGISCTPGSGPNQTTSGGLRVTDVWRVAHSFGVNVQYGGENGALIDWPAWALETRLREGQGAIVLGDANNAPVNPTAGVVYHSAWVHDFRMGSVAETHWHDPRNTGPQWVSIASVIRYWQGMDHGRRFAGFVEPAQVIAPPDTSTGGAPMAEIPVTGFTPWTGQVTVKVDGCKAINTLTGRADVGIPKGTTKQAVAVATLGPSQIPEGQVSGLAYLVGSQPRWLLERDVSLSPGAGNPTVLPAGNYLVRG